jgi:hypothetical protein
MIEGDEMPEPVEVASLASESITRLKTIEPYLLPPLIQFETMDASEYVSADNQEKEKIEDPNQ